MNPRYTLYHPKWHRARIPIFWWLRQPSYARFIGRELTSLAVGYGGVFLLVYVWSLEHGEEAYIRLLAWLRHPAVLLFHAMVLAALVVHSITWLNLAPKALVLHLAKRRVPDRLVLAAHYLAWLVCSGAMIWILLEG